MSEELSSICRVCLSLEGKFYPIKAHGLGVVFEQLTGLWAKADDRLPPALCEKCNNQLRSFQQFQLTSKQSNDLLYDVLKRFHCITKEFIAKIKNENAQIDNDSAVKVEDSTKIFLNSNLDELQPEVKLEIVYESDTENCEEFANTECVATPIDTYTTPVDSYTTPIDTYATPIDNYTTEIDTSTTTIDTYTTPIDTAKTNYNSSNRKRALRKNTSLTKRTVTSKAKRNVTSIAKRKRQSPVAIKRRKKVKKTKVKKTPLNSEAEALIKSCFRVKKLTHDEQVALYRKREETLHYKVAPFKCTKCYSGFINETMLNNHIVQHTDAKGLYECDICKTHFRTKCRVKIHLNYGPHNLRYECRNCNLVTVHRSTATQHADWHKGITFECKDCNKVFNMKSTYKNHLRVKHASGFVCVYCGHNFFNEKGLMSHKARQHRLDGHLPVEGPKCVPCDIRFVSHDALTAHCSVSPKHVKINNIWSSSYTTANPLGRNELRQLRKQIKLADNKVGDAIVCEQCGMELKNPRAYHAHFRSKHPGNTRTLYPSVSRPLVCELCGRLFQSKAQLSYHMNTHTGEGEMKCTQCDEAFPTLAAFRAHKKKHLNVLCNVCGRQFTDPSNIGAH